MDRLRTVYANILSIIYTLGDSVTPVGVGLTSEAIEQKADQIWSTLSSIKAELRQSQATLNLEGFADHEIGALLAAIVRDAGAYVVGKQENDRASKAGITGIIRTDPPFPFEEMRGYLTSIEVNIERLEGLLAEQLAIPRLPASSLPKDESVHAVAPFRRFLHFALSLHLWLPAFMKDGHRNSG